MSLSNQERCVSHVIAKREGRVFMGGYLFEAQIDPNDPFRDSKYLGEMAVCLTYVEKRCQEDLKEFQR